LVIHGQYQTLSVSLFGVDLAAVAGVEPGVAAAEVDATKPPPAFDPAAAAAVAAADRAAEEVVPGALKSAVTPILDLWRAAGEAAPVGAGVVDGLRVAAAAAAGGSSPTGDEGGAPSPPPAANGHQHAPTMKDADMDDVVAAALTWCRSLAGTPPAADPSPRSVAGVAVAALACWAPPLARRFVEGGGIGILGDVLKRGGGDGDSGSAIVADAIAALAAATAAVPGVSVPVSSVGVDGEPASAPVDRVATLLAAGPLDPAVVTAGLSIVSRAGVWSAARAFVAAATAAGQAAAGPGGATTRTVQAALAPAATAADRLAAALARTAPLPRPHAVAARVDPRAGIAAASPRAPDRAAVVLLGAAGVWAAAAAAARAPALHAARLQADGKLPPDTSAGAVAGALVGPLSRHLAKLVALALGAAGGARAMLGEGAALEALAAALAGGEEEQAGGPSAGLRVSLGAATDAASFAVGGPASTPALARLVEASVSEAGRRAVVSALASDAAALDAALAAVSAPRAPRADGDPAGSTAWRADARYAAELVALLARDSSPAALSAWQRRAGRVRRAMARAAESCPAGAGGFRDPGLAAAAEVHARAAAVEAAATGGLARTLLSLATALPRLVLPDKAGRRGVRHPDPASVRAFCLNAAMAGAAHARLSLLAAVLSQRGGARAAGEAADAGGLAVVEAAVRVSTAGLVASTADGLWEDVGGDALDAATAATLRARAAGLATVAARVAGALLRRLAGLGAAGGAAALQDALLALYAAAATSPEALAALRGSPGSASAGAAPLLAARVAAARALAAWIDRAGGGGGAAAARPPWTPDLLGAALTAGRAASAQTAPLPEAAALSPSQPLAVLALLGDLLPPEWPPPGAVRSARPHPPPSRMADRAALARACVPVAEGLSRLVANAAAAEPALVRAALVRAVARAAGLGGGMGVFLMGPLVDTLKTAAAGAAAAAAPATPAPGAVAAAHAAARRALEVVVPLAYRPALKAALLDLGTVDALARLLARLIPIAAAGGATAPVTTHAPPPPRTPAVPPTSPAAAGAMVTMALEAAAALCNPAIALDPSAGEDARGASDGPPGSQASVLVAVLFASLPRLGANAHVAARVVALLAGNAPGRAALVAAAGRWCGQKEPELAGEGGAAGPEAALAWAAGRLRSEGEKGGDPAVAKTVAATLESVAGAGQLVAVGEEDAPTVDPAPRRFAAAVAASLRAAPSTSTTTPAGRDPADLCAGCCVNGAASSDDGGSSSTDGGDPGDDPGGVAGFGLPSIHDASTRMFWRNITARQGEASAPPRTGTGTVAYGLPPGLPAAAPAAAWPAGLTPQKRPREVGVGELRGAPMLARLPASVVTGGWGGGGGGR